MNKIYKILGKRGRITIPFEIRQRMGFSYNDVLSFTEADDKRTVIVKREKICDGCKSEKKEMDEVTLLDFLNGLSDDEQRAALIHLSVRWAQNQATNAGIKASESVNGFECELGAGSACWAEQNGGGLYER